MMLLDLADAVRQSRDCQKEAWEQHKVVCSSTEDAHALLNRFVPNNDSPLYLALREKLEMKTAIQEWCRRRGAVLNWTCFNAFDLRHHSERSVTHVMLVELQLAGDNQTAKKKRFKIMDTYLLTRAELATARPDDIGRLFGMENDMPKASERIRTFMLVACGIFSHYVFLEWDDDELEELSIDAEWRAISKSLANDHEEYELVNGNPVRKEMTITFVHSILIKARTDNIAPILEISSHSKLQGVLQRAPRGIIRSHHMNHLYSHSRIANRNLFPNSDVPRDWHIADVFLESFH
jgi:hypothetical protein